MTNTNTPDKNPINGKVIVTIRMPGDLYDYLTKLAEEEHRSLSAQIIVLLEEVTSE